MMQDRGGNKMSDDIGQPWDGHLWYLVYWLDGSKYEILRDTNKKLRGYDLTPRRGSHDRDRKAALARQPFTLEATATRRAELEGHLRMVT